MIYTDKLFGNFRRPRWSGFVRLDDYTPGSLSGQGLKPGANARSVMGIVVPTTTKGRPSPPNAYSGTPTGLAYGTDRGHLMGLELGGPDISENIAPQTSLWQQSGGWRYLEKAVVQEALWVMGWNTVRDPSTYNTKADTAPTTALFFRVSPSPFEIENGEPDSYIGSIAVVYPYQNNGVWTYAPDRRWYKCFTIKPNGFTWR